MGITSLQVDSPLGRWTAHRWQPAHLAGVVDFLWHFEGRLTHLRERAFPSGMLELIVHFSEPYRLVEGEGMDRCSTACLTGLQTAPIVVEAPPGPTCVMGIRLHPAGAYALLERPLSELSGLTADLQDLVGRASAELTEVCAGASSTEERLRRAAAWVAERVAQSPGVDPAIAWIASQIERCQGAVSISELRDRTGLTKTRLATAFREQIGVAPKLYARLLRFRHTLNLLNEGPGSLADLACTAGYYDQPHMNAEFRELAGLTPREFLAARRYENSVSVAEVS
jgi:AraC-like DNA-binding protein